LYGDYVYWDATTWTIGSLDIKIGGNAGKLSQQQNAIAIGNNAGSNTQGPNAIAIGVSAGYNSQGSGAVAIGKFAGESTQGINAVAIGNFAGASRQGLNAVAIGYGAGKSDQYDYAVAIGNLAGELTQGPSAVAIGSNAGQHSQGTYAIAIGNFAGNSFQGTGAIAIGCQAGFLSQGPGAIAIGGVSGAATDQSQGSYSICIGTNARSTFANSIVIDACGGEQELYADASNAFYVAPVRTADASGSMLIWNPIKKEIQASSFQQYDIQGFYPGQIIKTLYYSSTHGDFTGGTLTIPRNPSLPYGILTVNFVPLNVSFKTSIIASFVLCSYIDGYGQDTYTLSLKYNNNGICGKAFNYNTQPINGNASEIRQANIFSRGSITLNANQSSNMTFNLQLTSGADDAMYVDLNNTDIMIQQLYG
jgi:hypothetical protein